MCHSIYTVTSYGMENQINIRSIFTLKQAQGGLKIINIFNFDSMVQAAQHNVYRFGQNLNF